MADQTVSNAAENQDMGVKEIQLAPVLRQTDEKGDILKSLNTKNSRSVFLKIRFPCLWGEWELVVRFLQSTQHCSEQHKREKLSGIYEGLERISEKKKVRHIIKC